MTTLNTTTTAPLSVYPMVPEDYAVWEHLCCRLAGIPRGLRLENCRPALQWEQRLRRDHRHDAESTRHQPDSTLITHAAQLSAVQNSDATSSTFPGSPPPVGRRTCLLAPASVKPELTLEDWVVWLNLFNREHPRLYASLMLNSFGAAGRRDYQIQRGLAGVRTFGISMHPSNEPVCHSAE